MRVLVTRPQPDARETANLLKMRGHQAIVAPLLSVNYRDGPEIDLSGAHAILATSANGVRAIARRTQRRDLQVFAVGPQTARIASEAGFHQVKSADGDARALAGAVSGWAVPEQGCLVHACGLEGDGALASALIAAGFRVRTEILYEVGEVDALPSVAHDALANAGLDAVLLYSPRSARVFAELVDHAGLGGAASKLIAACISPAAASNLARLNMRDIRVAQRPNQSSLLDCLNQ
jgi:uroporphyrinogen-III synthase